jgi:lipopolysaccharide export system protein LptA
VTRGATMRGRIALTAATVAGALVFGTPQAAAQWRMDAHGGVVITRGEERATADRAEFDAQTNTVTLSGNVVIRRGDAEMRGPRAIMDMTTGVVQMQAMPSDLLHRGRYRSGRS